MIHSSQAFRPGYDTPSVYWSPVNRPRAPVLRSRPTPVRHGAGVPRRGRGPHRHLLPVAPGGRPRLEHWRTIVFPEKGRGRPGSARCRPRSRRTRPDGASCPGTPRRPCLRSAPLWNLKTHGTTPFLTQVATVDLVWPSPRHLPVETAERAADRGVFLLGPEASWWTNHDAGCGAANGLTPLFESACGSPGATLRVVRGGEALSVGGQV